MEVHLAHQVAAAQPGAVVAGVLGDGPQIELEGPLAVPGEAGALGHAQPAEGIRRVQAQRLFEQADRLADAPLQQRQFPLVAQRIQVAHAAVQRGAVGARAPLADRRQVGADARHERRRRGAGPLLGGVLQQAAGDRHGIEQHQRMVGKRAPRLRDHGARRLHAVQGQQPRRRPRAQVGQPRQRAAVFELQPQRLLPGGAQMSDGRLQPGLRQDLVIETAQRLAAQPVVEVGLVGVRGDRLPQDPQVALARAGAAVGVAAVVHHRQVALEDRLAGARAPVGQVRRHALEDRVAVQHAGQAAEQAHAPLDLVGVAGLRADHAQTVGGRAGIAQEALELHRADRLQDLVGVQEQDPVPVRLGQRDVARRREVVLPRRVDHPRAVAFGDDARVVPRTGVDDHDLVDEGQHGLDGHADRGFLVARDDAQADGLSLHGGFRPRSGCRRCECPVGVSASGAWGLGDSRGAPRDPRRGCQTPRSGPV